MTQSPAWRRVFTPLEEAVVAASGRLPPEEEPVLFFRSQGTLAVVRNLVAQLHRPFQDLKDLAPHHPLAGQTLPCVEAFDLAVERAFGTCRKRKEELTRFRRGGRGRKASPDAVPASQPAERPARAKTPASRKFKHRWRGKFSVRMG